MIGRRAFLHAAGLAACALPLAGCGRRDGLRAPRAVRLAIGADPLTLDFARARDSVGVQLSHLVSDGLVGVDAALAPVPRVARSWSWSADHRELCFALREDARWHDGRPVTPDDVVFTFERNTDSRTGIPDRALVYNLVESVEPDGPHGVRVRYKAPFAPALLSWWFAPLVPRHRPPDDGLPLGCGPFRFTSWTTGQRIGLDAFEGYYAGPPGVARLELEILRDYSTRFAALRAGQLDLCPLLPDHLARYEADPDLQRTFRVETFRVLFFQYVAWRMDGSNPFFGDVRVRRALTYAMDRAAYVEKVAGGAAEAAVTSFHPDLWAHDPELAPWPFDPARAAALLDEAGWLATPGGVRRKDGRPFAFRLTYPQTGPETEKIAVFVAASLRAVGVDARLEPVEWTQLQQRQRARAYEALLGFRQIDPDPDPYDLWHSSQAAAGVNYAGLADPQVDAWIEAGRQSFDRAERQALYRRIERRLHELQPDTFLAYPLSRNAVDRRLDGVRGTALGLLTHWPGPFGWRWNLPAGT